MTAGALGCAALLAGCGGAPDRSAAPAPAALHGAEAHAPAPATSATLTRVPDSAAARRRLGYVNPERLAAADLPVGAAQIRRRVLGPRAAGATVRVGDAAFDPSGPVPEVNAIAPSAPSAAQSCLGDTLAQTIVGMGRDAAVGVGLAESDDRPAGIQLRICGAAHLVRDLHTMQRRLERRFAGVTAVVRETEIGEREIVGASVAADELPARELLALLGAGDALRDLAWNKKVTRR